MSDEEAGQANGKSDGLASDETNNAAPPQPHEALTITVQRPVYNQVRKHFH